MHLHSLDKYEMPDTDYYFWWRDSDPMVKMAEEEVQQVDIVSC